MAHTTALRWVAVPAAGLTLAAGAVAGPTAASGTAPAAAVTSPATATSATTITSAATARPPVTSRVDIDGDGRGDTTTMRFVSVKNDIHRFQVTVKTATGRTATMPVYVESYDRLTPKDVWVGVTGVDGVRGNDIVLELGGGIGDFAWTNVYAWRGGRLAVVVAPGKSGRNPSWDDMYPPFQIAGHTFSMKGATRYVVRHDLYPSRSRRSYSGWNTTHRWTARGWLKVGRTPTGVYPAKTADATFGGLHGLIWR